LESVQQGFLQKMIESVFKGSSKKLIMQALGNHKPTKKELDEIKHMIDHIDSKSNDKNHD